MFVSKRKSRKIPKLGALAVPPPKLVWSLGGIVPKAVPNSRARMVRGFEPKILIF